MDTDTEIKEKEIKGPMAQALSDMSMPPKDGDLVEGGVISIDKSAVYVDLGFWGTGIIFGREYINARDLIKKINIGDSVAGKVVGRDNKEGYIEMSLKEARQALIWNEAEEAISQKKVFELAITEANKGGLILSWSHTFLAGYHRLLACFSA
jgi:ribosomal protein S1